MSADRYEITDADHGQMRITDSHGEHVYLNPIASRTSAASVGAIRQQARDIAELETDVSGLRSSEAAFKNDCEQLRTDLAAAVARAEQAEARLAAIESAPTVATVEVYNDGETEWPILNYTALPPPGSELIARPAKG